MERVTTFKYLGSTLAENVDGQSVTRVLCERRISLKVKGKVHKTVVRPAMMYDAETWGVKKAQEKKLDVMEMRMLRWMSGVTKAS